MDRPVTPSSHYGSQAPHSEVGSPPSTRPGQVNSSSRPVSYVNNGNLVGDGNLDIDQAGGPRPTSALSGHNDESHITAAEPPSSLVRSDSRLSQQQTALPSRGGTLKKKSSMKRTGSLGRTASRKSSYAGSVRSMKLGEKEKYEETPESNSAFYCPVPTQGNPTELLATRFQAWRKVLKDLITYFRDLHKSYDMRGKTLMSASNVINNITIPSNFMTSGGIGEAVYTLRDFHKQQLTDTNKARDLQNEVVMQLTGLRSDLQQKIKEIKSLSGDFKNGVEKEQEGTKRAVRALQEALGLVDADSASTSGKGDPFLIKMGVDKQLEKQIEEENYLHRAYLNLEASGRELESIVVGEIQKAYNVLAGIFSREATLDIDAAEKLKEGPIALAKDHEWNTFVTNNNQMVDPRNPVRQAANITYPGQDHPAAIEVRSGMLERKSKYLKNYTPGWYILSPTHLHEFKSADRIASQAPVMSLFLPEQKLGNHSEGGGSSHKFMLKGRQSGGSMHRGHSWVFRAESHDTMLAWFADIKELTEKRGEARNEFVRRTHARSISQTSQKAPSIVSSEGDMAEEDEADKAPFSGEASVRGQSTSRASEGVPAVAVLGVDGADGTNGVGAVEDDRSEAGWRPQRPQPGGRFPSDINVARGLQQPTSPSTLGGESDRDALAAAGALPGSGIPFASTPHQHTDLQSPVAHEAAAPASSAPSAPSAAPAAGQQNYAPGHHPNIFATAAGAAAPHETESSYGEWMAPIAAGAGGAALGAGAMHHHHATNQQPTEPIIENVDNSKRQMEAASSVPAYGSSSVPIPVEAENIERSLSRPRGLTESTQATTHFAPSTAGAATINTVSTAPTDYSEQAPGSGVFVAEKPMPMTATLVDTRAPMSTTSGIFGERPTFEKTHTGVMTISDLPVPGSFPKTPGDSRANSTFETY